MRLLLLPISKKHMLVYAQRLNQQLTSRKGYTERITAWAGRKWAEWEASDTRYKRKVTTWGNTAFARIPYQEWGLKSIPPLSARRKNEELRGKEEVDALFPSSIIKEANVHNLLRKLATERQALHRKWMWWSIVGIPLTIPIGIIPIIPNLPLFYVTFRAWSHWKALSGSKHLEFLLNNRLIRLVESSGLSKIYAAGDFAKQELDDMQKCVQGAKSQEEREQEVVRRLGSEQEDVMAENLNSDSGNYRLLARKDTGRLVSILFGLPQVTVELERASSQVSNELSKELEERQGK